MKNWKLQNEERKSTVKEIIQDTKKLKSNWKETW